MNEDIFEIYRPDDDIVLPELRGLGCCRTVGPRLGGPRTDGLNFLEIGYIASGSIEWLTKDGLEEATAGHFVVDQPGDWQGGMAAIVHPCVRYWLRFNPKDLQRTVGMSPETAAHVQERLHEMRPRHFKSSQPIQSYFEQLLDQQRNPGLFAEELSRAAFHQVLFRVVSDHIDDREQQRSDAVRRALAYIQDNLAEDIAVEDIAAEVGLSPGYFHELFHRETGDTPARHLMHLRLAAAKVRLVRTDLPITPLALELGFSSSQYFATAFRRHVGMTPREYRRVRREDDGAALGSYPKNLVDERGRGVSSVMSNVTMKRTRY